MIARKIVYSGSFNDESLDLICDITRRISITGEIKRKGTNHIELDLEGDPSMIKLIQHQIERRVKTTGKEVTQIPFANYLNLIISR
jgi:hypothetical protein